MMQNFNFFEIPEGLLDKFHNSEDVSILIGENGSGKSTILNKLSYYYLQTHYDNVIGIANTIYDKFDSKSSRFKTLKVSQGKSLVKKTISEALKTANSNDNNKLRNIARALEYTGFSSGIGIRIRGLNHEYKNLIIESNMTDDDREMVLYFLNKFDELESTQNEIFWINFSQDNFNSIKDSFVINLLLYESQLKSLKILNNIDFFLSKNGDTIHISQASSGELTVISSLIYLASVITENSTILIDEPENSLHPKWQIEYVKTLLDLFYLYQPKIVIATHSPLIINGAELTVKNIKVYKGINGKFILQEKEPTNVEEIYSRYFDVTTPENRFLSEKVIEKMNMLASKEITFKNFKEFINHLEENAYDDTQKEALEGIIDLAQRIS